MDSETRERAHAWRSLVPWHDVIYGLGPGTSDDVARGLSAIRELLARERG